jgi:RHS repeat-associated protein
MDALVGAPPGQLEVTVDYDDADNRIGEQAIGGSPIASPVDAMDRTRDRNGQPMVYDSDGNLGDDGIHEFGYDAWNRLVQVTEKDSQAVVAEYAHDARGRRILETTPTKAIVLAYDATDLVAELEAGLVVSQVVHQATGLGPLQIAAHGTEVWPHADLVGSTRLLTGPQSSVEERFDYQPFGQLIGPNPSGHRWLFCGRRIDLSTATYDHGARQYDPVSGRYLQSDPAWPETHPYAYARNNPLRFHDPTGLMARSAQDRWIFYRTASGVEFTEDLPTPWGSTRDMLRNAGFQPLEVPWEAISAAVTAVGTGAVRREGRSFWTEIGTAIRQVAAEAIIGQIPPTLYQWTIKDSYLADQTDALVPVGHNEVEHMADRAVRRWGAGGSRQVDYWVNTVAQVAGGLSAATAAIAPGLMAMAGRAMAAAESAESRAIAMVRYAAAARIADTEVRRMLRGTDEYTRLFFGFRDLAVDQTRIVAANAARAGQNIVPREFGNIADAVFKTHVLEAIDRGVLPDSVVVIGRGSRGPDVIDTATGIAWDLTTATVQQVADHDTRYIGRMIDTERGRVLIRDVLTLVYTR